MDAPIISPDLVAALKRLKLGRIVDTLSDRLVLAEKQDMPFEDLLLLLLTDEVSRRETTAADHRAREASLDPSMRLEQWDKTAKVSFDKRMLAELASLRFLETHRHVVVLGAVGSRQDLPRGDALGHIACRHGYRVRFQRADAMLRTLRAEPTRQLPRRGDDRAHHGRPPHPRRLRARADEQGGEQGRVPTLPRAHRSRVDDRDEQPRTPPSGSRCSTTYSSRRAPSTRFKNAAYDFVIEGESYRPRLKPKLDESGTSPATPASRSLRPHPRAPAGADRARHPRRPVSSAAGWPHDPATERRRPLRGPAPTSLDAGGVSWHAGAVTPTVSPGPMTLQIGWTHGECKLAEGRCETGGPTRRDAARVPALY